MQGVKLLGLAVLVLALLAVVLLPTKLVAHTDTITGHAVQEYAVAVPYNETKTVNPSGTVTLHDCADAPVEFGERWDYCDLETAQYRITSRDSVSGDYTVFVGYKTGKGRIYGANVTSFVPSDGYGTFEYTNTNSTGNECYAKVMIAPTKTVCIDRQVPAQPYNETVTLYRNETRSLTIDVPQEVNTTYEVNWLFGFNALIGWH